MGCCQTYKVENEVLISQTQTYLPEIQEENDGFDDLSLTSQSERYDNSKAECPTSMILNTSFSTFKVSFAQDDSYSRMNISTECDRCPVVTPKFGYSLDFQSLVSLEGERIKSLILNKQLRDAQRSFC
jgi:hypothetical protein